MSKATFGWTLPALKKAASRVLAQWKTIIVPSLMALVGFSVISQQGRIVVEPFTASTGVETGSGPAEGLTEAFRFELARLIEGSESRISSPELRHLPEMPDIQVASVSFSALARYIAGVVGYSPYVIRGHLTKTAEYGDLTVTVSGGKLPSDITRRFRRPSAELNDSIVASARDVLKTITPVRLASYCAAHSTECEPVEALSYAIQHPPGDDDVWAFNAWAQVLMGRNDIIAAEQMLWSALQLDPEFGFAHFNKGRLLANGNRTEEAKREYLLAIRHGDGYVRSLAHTNLAYVLQDEQKPTEAIKELREAIRMNPQLSEPHAMLGNLLLANKDVGGAIREYVRASILSSTDPTPMLNWGAALASQGSMAEARQRYEDAAGKFPTHPLPYYFLAEWFLDNKQPDEARAYFQRAADLSEGYEGVRDKAESRLEEISGQSKQPEVSG